MFKFLSSTVIFTFSFLGIWAQDSTMQWVKTYGGSDEDKVYSIISTNDSGYIIAGYTASTNGDITSNHGENDVWIVKFDKGGTLQWQKTYGGSKSEYASQILETADKGYIFVGGTSSSDGDVKHNNGNLDFWVVKLNNKGAIDWEKSYGGSDYDGAENVAITPDSGYIVTGSTASNDSDISYNHGQTDVWIIKLDKKGDMIWQKTYGGTGFDAPRAMIASKEDSSYLIAAIPGNKDGDITQLFGNGDAWVFKINKSGKIVWQKTYGTKLHDNITSIARASDSTYILTGASGADPTFTNFDDVWVFKISKKDSSVLWDTTYGGSYEDIGNSVLQTTDNGCIITGTTQSHDFDVTGSYTLGKTAMWTFKLSGSGKLLWQRINGGLISNNAGISIAQSVDKGYLIAGTTSSHGTDIFLAKLSGHWIPNIANNSNCIPAVFNLEIEPPIKASDSLTIEWDFGEGKGYVSGTDTASISYLKPGNYTVKLRITNNRFIYAGTVVSEDSLLVSVNGKALATPSIILQGKDTLVSSYSLKSCIWYMATTIVSTGNCYYVPVKPGKYKVAVEDSNGCVSPLSAEYDFIFTGIKPLENQEEIRISPNPANTLLHISPPNTMQQPPILFSITDMQGRSIKTLQLSEIYKTLYVDISQLPAGMYFVHCQSENGIWNGKFIKN